MSKLGNIYLSYGKQFNIAIANTYSNIVLTGSNLPVNTIIISSNIDEDNNDTGSYSLLVSDSYGTPIRLTYNITPGNGLNIDGDILKLNIDNDTIKDDGNGIYIDLSKFENNFINLNDNRFSINNNSIDIISNTDRGVCKCDNKTINIDEGIIYINTDNLEYSNNSTEQYGIFISSDDSLNINNGIISIVQDNLPKSSDTNYGICKVDSETIDIDDNSSLKVNTENLKKSNLNDFGIIKTDGNKILSDNGVLKVNTYNLNIADENNFGIIKIDNDTIKLNESGQITSKKFKSISNDINKLYDNISNDLNELENLKNEFLTQMK